MYTDVMFFSSGSVPQYGIDYILSFQDWTVIDQMVSDQIVPLGDWAV